MPRKQRFKPSRKPQNPQVQVANQQVDDRKEIPPEPQPERDREAPAIIREPDVE